MAASRGDAHRIVVGADGSASAGVALLWAVQQAELTGGSVDAVTAWQYPAAYGGYGMAPFPLCQTRLRHRSERNLCSEQGRDRNYLK